MSEPLLALTALAAAAAAVGLWIAWRGRRLRQTGALDLLRAYNAHDASALVLAFTMPDCVPCKTLQRPALEALAQRYPRRIVTSEVDALTAPDLARRFGIFTVPSTVVIGADGRIRAINHGAAASDQLAVQAGVNGGPPH